MKASAVDDRMEESFANIRWWADEAIYRIRSGRTDMPSTDILRQNPVGEHSCCSIVETCAEVHDDGRHKRIVIGIKTKRWPDEATRFRYVLPAHFAILRAIELVPGMSIFLANDRNKARDAAQGVRRSQDEMIYNLTLSVARGSLKIIGRTELDRILFNIDPFTTLYARRSGDHHYILPSGAVPITTRIRKRPYSDQRAFLLAVRSMMLKKGRSLPFSRQDIHGLLKNLFVISDELHWSELIDRLPADERRRNRDFVFDGVRRRELARNPIQQVIQAIASKKC
jgi:hypothetical protein